MGQLMRAADVLVEGRHGCVNPALGADALPGYMRALALRPIGREGADGVRQLLHL